MREADAVALAKAHQEPRVPRPPRYRLAVWIAHPIQYQAPLFRKLAQHPAIDFVAYYGSQHGSVEGVDPEFGVAFRWDTPLLEGYHYEFLRNYSPRRVPTGFWWVANPGIVRELYHHRYDAVMIHGYASATSWLAYFGAWLTHTPVLFRGETVLRQETGWKRAVKGAALRFLFRHTAGCLATGRRSEEFYRAHDVPGSKVFLAPYCVDNQFFMNLGDRGRATRDETRRELGLARELPVVLYSGKLIPRKRPMDVIEAVARLRAPVGVLFVGSGPLRAELEKGAARRGLQHARFVGFQNQSQLARYYAAADIFVFPSAYESYGLAVNEALCLGLPVVTTPAVASAADLVREGENGFMYSVGDIEWLARRLGLLAADAALRRKMGERSRQIIAAWNYDRAVEAIVAALRHVMETRCENPNLQGGHVRNSDGAECIAGLRAMRKASG